MIRLLQRGSSLVKPPVSLKIFDSDDPNSDTIIDPNGIAGNDNNTTLIPKHGKLLGCTPTGVDSCSGVTDSSGTATAFFEVSKQPGDNFLVVASLDKTYLDTLILDGINIRDPATGGTIGNADNRAMDTDLLTVWRKLHIEVDSMGPVVGNQVPGTIDSVVLLGSNQADLTLVPGSPPVGIPLFDLSNNRFQNGKIYINNTTYPVISSNDVSNGKFTVKIDRSNGVAIVAGSLFSLVDDDDFNNSNGQVLKGDEGEDIPAPDLSLMRTSYDPGENVFAPAYIIPVYDLSGQSSSVPIKLNSPDGLLGSTFEFNNYRASLDKNFWTVYLLGGYQDDVKLDGDPFVQNGSIGLGGSDGLGASVFNESFQEIPIDQFTSVAATAAHEIGHLLNGNHDDLGLMEQSSTRRSLKFSSETLMKMRKLLKP